MDGTAGDAMGERSTAERGIPRSARFALAKFRPTTLPTTLLTRPTLLGRLEAGASQHLTVVVGSAGAGKSVLLSNWAATREGGVTSWLSCDEADADPVRFWAAFIQAPRAAAPGFGADAAELLALDGVMSADVTASIANDAARLPAGSAIVVDDFHAAAAGAARNMTDLVERWPAQTVQLVLAGRVDPPLRLHRLRLSGELCEVRDSDLYLSLAESAALLEKFGVQVAPGELALLHGRSEGWVAALQMAALTLRRTKDPAQIVRALDVRSHAIAEYFVGEVLEQQPPEVAGFMLETSVLDELTAEACAAVTGRQDATALLRSIEAANLFLVALDDDRTRYRYHHLVREVLRAQLRATDRSRELTLQLRAAEWLESVGETRGATRYFLAAGQADRALGLLQERVAGRNPSYWHEPMSWRHCSAWPSATRAQPPNWWTGFPPPGAACCWPRPRSPPAITTAAVEHLNAATLGDLTPRAALVRQVLLAAAAIERGDPKAAGIVGDVLQAARRDGFLNTVVTTAPQVTRYLVEHSTDAMPDPFLGRIIGAALEVRAMRPERSGRLVTAPLSDAELRVLKLLPTTGYAQIAATLFISHNTVKTHLRSIYQKLGGSSRSEAIERAVELRLL